MYVCARYTYFVYARTKMICTQYYKRIYVLCYSCLPKASAQREESQETRTGSVGTRVEAKGSAGGDDQSGRCTSRRTPYTNRYVVGWIQKKNKKLYHVNNMLCIPILYLTA